MKLIDITEDTKPGRFGSDKNEDIDIPKGFDSFYVRKINDRVGKIIGVRTDGSEKNINTGHLELMNMLAKEYNSGGRGGTGLQPISMLQAFGTDWIHHFEDAGVTLQEKPTTFDDINKSIDSFKLRGLEKKAGSRLQTIEARDYFAGPVGGPLQDIKSSVPDTAIVVMPNGERYIADRSGSKSYARMWLKINVG